MELLEIMTNNPNLTSFQNESIIQKQRGEKNTLKLSCGIKKIFF